jgi:hypothetical protein
MLHLSIFSQTHLHSPCCTKLNSEIFNVLFLRILKIILNLVQHSNKWKITVYRKWATINTTNMQVHLEGLKLFLGVVLTHNRAWNTTVLHVTLISLTQIFLTLKKWITKGKTYTVKKNNKIKIYIYVSTSIHKHFIIQLSYRAVVLQHSSFTQQVYNIM